jgi:hypothetical protein
MQAPVVSVSHGGDRTVGAASVPVPACYSVVAGTPKRQLVGPAWG